MVARCIRGKEVARACPRVHLHVGLRQPRAHKHPNEVSWLAKAPKGLVARHPDVGLLAEHGLGIVFTVITKLALRRTTSTSGRDLKLTIQIYIDGFNERCDPFIRAKDADTILG